MLFVQVVFGFFASAVCVCVFRSLFVFAHTRCTGGGIAKHISLCESEAIFCVYLHMVLGGVTEGLANG